MQTTVLSQAELSNLIKPEILEALNAIQVEAIKFVLGANFDKFVKLATKELRKQGIELSDDYLGRAEIALKMYYILPIIDPVNFHAVSDTLDPFWHAHVLHTAEYTQFCRTAVGDYMPHEPLDHDDEPTVELVTRMYLYTVECMEKIFVSYDKEFYPSNPVSSQVCCCHVGACENTVSYSTTPYALFPHNQIVRELASVA